MTNAMSLILRLQIFFTWMGMFLVEHPVVFWRFARVSHVMTLNNTRNKLLNAKLLNQGYRNLKLREAFSKFYGRHFDLISKFNIGLKSLRNLNFIVTSYTNSDKYMLAMILALNSIKSFFNI